MRDESEGMRRRKVPPRRRDQSRRTDLKGEEAEGEDRSRRERRRDRGGAWRLNNTGCQMRTKGIKQLP
jgi:hypothetical protein